MSCRDPWPLGAEMSDALETVAADLAAAVLRVHGFVECFAIELRAERAMARLDASGAGEPEGLLAERLELQRERLRSVHAWAVAVSEGAADWGRS